MKRKKTTNSKTGKKRNSQGINFRAIVIIAFCAFVCWVLFFYRNDILLSKAELAHKNTDENYASEVDKYASQFDIPAQYCKSLIMLECSGRKPSPSRFEEHVYQSLKQVKSGYKKSYGALTKAQLKNTNDGALQNLASSWGPFQIMGYKCLELNITISELRGEKAVYWGMKWINENYGEVLRQHRYRDAFHIHNTGRPFPKNGESKTFDPDYVTRGIKYMDFFKDE